MRVLSLLLLTLSGLGACASPSDKATAVEAQALSVNHRFETIVVKPQIWGGSSAPSGSFIALLGVASAGGFFTGTCGGALIDARWVLTAAHCAGNAVILGRLRPSDSGGEVHPYAKTDSFCHEDYDEITLENDVALIRLPLSSSITPISLAENDNWETSSPPPEVLLAGWGDGTSSPDLQIVRVSLLTDRARCKDFLETGKFILDDKAFCTFSSTGGALGDDSGGPVLFGSRLVGIMSAGDIAGEPNKHSRVARYLDWIKEVMSSDGKSDTKPCQI